MSALTQIVTILLSITILSLFLPSFLPLDLLRLLPLISSTINLTFALDEYMFLSTFLHPAYAAQAAAFLPAYFTIWGTKGRWVVLLSFPFTFGSGIANILTNGGKELGMWGDGTKWYWGGVVFTTVHLLGFGKMAISLLAEIKRDRPVGNGIVAMEKWLRMHVLRSFIADLPAVICFALGVLSALDDVGEM